MEEPSGRNTSKSVFCLSWPKFVPSSPQRDLLEERGLARTLKKGLEVRFVAISLKKMNTFL